MKPYRGRVAAWAVVVRAAKGETVAAKVALEEVVSGRVKVEVTRVSAMEEVPWVMAKDMAKVARGVGGVAVVAAVDGMAGS